MMIIIQLLVRGGSTETTALLRAHRALKLLLKTENQLANRMEDEAGTGSLPWLEYGLTGNYVPTFLVYRAPQGSRNMTLRCI